MNARAHSDLDKSPVAIATLSVVGVNFVLLSAFLGYKVFKWCKKDEVPTGAPITV